jgi:hypothetical protein
MEELKR